MELVVEGPIAASSQHVVLLDCLHHLHVHQPSVRVTLAPREAMLVSLLQAFELRSEDPALAFFGVARQDASEHLSEAAPVRRRKQEEFYLPLDPRNVQ